MAVITITVADINLDKGTFRTHFAVEDSLLGAGQATAAYFTGYYLHSLIETEEFATACADFGNKLIAGITEEGAKPASIAEATVTLTLTDHDLTTGRYGAVLDTIECDAREERLPTTAEVVALYMRSLLNKTEFRDHVWAYAEEITTQHKAGKIANREQGPAFIANPDNGAASLAA